MTNDLTKKRDKAWTDWQDYIYTEHKPRFYREKVGRKLEYVNPYKTIEQRIAAEEKMYAMYKEWARLDFICSAAELPRMDWDLYSRWVQKDVEIAPGKIEHRWVRRKKTEDAPVSV